MFGRNTEQLNRELELILGGENQQVALQTGRKLHQSMQQTAQPLSPDSVGTFPLPPQSPAPTPQPQDPSFPSTRIIEKPTLASTPESTPVAPAKPLVVETPKTIEPIQMPNPVANTPDQTPPPKPYVKPAESAPRPVQSTPTREQQMRISKTNWDKYHEAWQNYYKHHYAELAQKTSGPKQAFGENMKREIQTEAYKKPLNFLKKLFSRKLLPFTVGILAILILCFFQYNRNIIGFFATLVAPSGGDISLAEIPDASIGTAISAEPKLYVPKINVSVPIVFGAKNDVDSQNKAMENGVAEFAIPGANALPGQVGNLAISGHSSNGLFDNGDYKFIFARLGRLESGDTIYLDYGGTRYVYKVTRKEEVLPSQSSKLVLKTDRPILTLITCTPVGTALRRLLVFAEQVSPTPAVAETPSDSQSDGDYELPSNSPTLFERIKALFSL